MNGKRYIGSAKCFRKRWYEHRRDLSRGNHHSVALQRAWRKHGAENFVFEVLEFCEAAVLIASEQLFIDAGCDYNICKVAGSSLGLKHSVEARAKMRDSQLRRSALPGYVNPQKGVKYSREICERMAAPKRGRKKGPMSEETKAKLSAAKIGIVRNVGRKASDETRQKLRQANLGKKKSVEQRIGDCRLTLDETQVREIRALRNSGLGYQQISGYTGVSRSLARLVCIKARYEWVDHDVNVVPFKRKGWKVADRKRGIIRAKAV